MDESRMRIAELAKRGGVSTPTLRYYEEEGLLRPAARSEAGYRLYTQEALGRVGFIRRAQALGLTLREIRQLMQDPTDPRTDIARLRHAVTHKLADTRRQIGELEALCNELEGMHYRLGAVTSTCGQLGDCECWLPTREEIAYMTMTKKADDTHLESTTTLVSVDGCDCCGCTCPSDGDCSCCSCAPGCI